jgi:hypothetical protein
MLSLPEKSLYFDSGIYSGNLVIEHFYKKLFKTGDISCG